MNIPNMLTLSRIIMIGFVVLLSAFSGSKVDDINTISALGVSYFVVRLIAVLIALVAGITDLIDGYLARKWNQITDFGALMDPLADKIFVSACMLIAVEYKLMPAWIAITVLSREFMVTGLRSLAAAKNVIISADKFGKLKTALQMIMLGIVGFSWINLVDLWSKYTWQWYVWIGYMCAVVAVTMYSGIAYFVRYRDLYLTPKEK